MSKGFLDEGFECLGLNEKDKVCCDTLKKNHPGIRVMHNDMTGLVSEEFECRPDVLIGGVPCQSFSQAGKRKGLDDPRGNLMMAFISLVKKMRPKVFMIENVRGLTTHNRGERMKDIIAGLSCDGEYEIQWRVLNAWDYGVPQKRERVFIVGLLATKDLVFHFPEKNGSRPVLKDILPLSIPLGAQHGVSYPGKKRVLRLIPPGGCWVDLPDDVKREYMGKSLEIGGGKRGIARRLSMEEPSLTLTTSPCQKQTERCHPLEDRPFTVEEYAAIQTFPGDYVFCGSITQKYRQIGNAVPWRAPWRDRSGRHCNELHVKNHDELNLF